MKKYTFNEIRTMFYDFNEAHGLTHKDTPGEYLHAAAVLAPRVFKEELRDTLTVDDRTYLFSSNNKMFFPNMLSSSCFSYCKTDNMDCIRLDYLDSYVEDIEYCYLIEE